MKIYEPHDCISCIFGDHEAWCLLPGEDKERYYMPNKGISENCPLDKLDPKKVRNFRYNSVKLISFGECPNCKYEINNAENRYCCGRCGQRLVWK